MINPDDGALDEEWIAEERACSTAELQCEIDALVSSWKAMSAKAGTGDPDDVAAVLAWCRERIVLSPEEPPPGPVVRLNEYGQPVRQCTLGELKQYCRRESSGKLRDA